MLTFKDQALIWLKSTIPVGLPAAGEIEINDNSAHQLGLSWGFG